MTSRPSTTVQPSRTHPLSYISLQFPKAQTHRPTTSAFSNDLASSPLKQDLIYSSSIIHSSSSYHAKLLETFKPHQKQLRPTQSQSLSSKIFKGLQNPSLKKSIFLQGQKTFGQVKQSTTIGSLCEKDFQSTGLKLLTKDQKRLVKYRSERKISGHPNTQYPKKISLFTKRSEIRINGQKIRTYSPFLVKSIEHPIYF